MFYKLKEAIALPNQMLSIQFANGTTKLYDIKVLQEKMPVFEALKDERLFSTVKVDPGGYGISWNDDLDLSCDELWEHGIEVETPFDGLLSFSDATELWGLSESALRKAVSYGKIVPGVDARKYGKQWIVTREAMIREYGDPDQRRANIDKKLAALKHLGRTAPSVSEGCEPLRPYKELRDQMYNEMYERYLELK